MVVISGNAFSSDWQDIQWTEYEDARAIESEKPIFVFAELHFCSACKKMKNEVFNQADIIKLINDHFIPVNMKAFGIFPNTLKDLSDRDGDPLELIGSPALVIVYRTQYKIVYGFQDSAQLSHLLTQAIQQIEASAS